MVVVRRGALHVVELREWQSDEREGVFLDPSDRSLVAELHAKDRRITIEELRSGLRIHASSWVGVVRLSQIEIRVLPKLVGAPTWLVAMLDYAGAVETLQRLAGDHSIDHAGNNLLDLFTLLLCEAAQRLWEGGLLADYVERVDELPVVRGRLLLDRQVRERFGRLDRLICRHDERETDIPENQLLGAALAIASRRTRSPALRRRAHRLASLYREQCDPHALDLAIARDVIVYHRLNRHYEAGHGLAWLVLQGLGVHDLLAPGPADCFAFLLNMNALFEAFVDRLVRRLLKPHGATVVSQRKDWNVLRDLTTAKAYSSVIPDLVVSGVNHACVPIDAKYKTYDGDKADRGDLYQAFVYAMAYRAHASHPARAMLMYPASSQGVSVRSISVNNPKLGTVAELRLCALPVAALLRDQSGGPTLQAVRAQLLRAFDVTPRDVAGTPSSA